MDARLACEMGRREVPPDFSFGYLSDAEWKEVDGLVASDGDPAAICDRLVEMLGRARARLPVMRPAPCKRSFADLGLAELYGAGNPDTNTCVVI
jgi:hypothetical protein